jgi:hypothetical protein
MTATAIGLQRNLRVDAIRYRPRHRYDSQEPEHKLLQSLLRKISAPVEIALTSVVTLDRVRAANHASPFLRTTNYTYTMV